MNRIRLALLVLAVVGSACAKPSGGSVSTVAPDDPPPPVDQPAALPGPPPPMAHPRPRVVSTRSIAEQAKAACTNKKTGAWECPAINPATFQYDPSWAAKKNGVTP